MKKARLVPINAAEAIIEPFWDPAQSGLASWKIRDGSAHGLKVGQFWCYVCFEWARRPAGGPALAMTRRFNLDCSGYDRLLVSVMAPRGSVVRIAARTDKGDRTFVAPRGAVKKEHALALRGARRLLDLTLTLEAGEEGIQAGWFNWVGLQNTGLLPHHLRQWQGVDAKWEGYLHPAAHHPEFAPKVGLLADAAEMAAMRRTHAAHVQKFGTSPFMEAAAKAAQIEPESRIGENIKCYAERLFCREREHDHNLLGLDLMGYAGRAAIAGSLGKDPQMLRLAARYALTMAPCTHWDDFNCFVPGGTWDQRCFTAASCAFQCALVLDLAWDCFTDLGRELVMQRIARSGLAEIRFNTWRYEYIYGCNQLAWFSYGRMAGALLLERFWPRARAEAEQAKRDLDESLRGIVLSDGGFVEGPSYFTTIGRHAGLTYYMYAKARRLRFAQVVPPVMRRMGAFAAAIASTDEAADVIPFCDSHAVLDHDTFGIMASILPDSAWTGIFRKALARQHGLGDTLTALALSPRIPRRSPPLPAFVRMPQMGVMASTRRLGRERVKLFLMGNRAHAGHTHEDKGSFVLEFAGETFALDPGTTDYSSPFAGTLKHCQCHNMLVPFGTDERPRPSSPLPSDVKPRGRGTARQFEATIDATPGWDAYYARWMRRWSSPAPHRLMIRDEYELKQGQGVVFYWQTRLPVQVVGRVVSITGRRGRAILEAPPDCTIGVEEMDMPGSGPDAEKMTWVKHYRIGIRRAAMAGVLEIGVRLQAGGTEKSLPPRRRGRRQGI